MLSKNVPVSTSRASSISPIPWSRTDSASSKTAKATAWFKRRQLELPLENRTLQLARLISLYSMGDSIFKPLCGRTRL